MTSTTDQDIAAGAYFDATTQPIALTEERSGLVRAANPAFLALIGLGRDEVVGRSVVDLGLWSDAGQRNSFLSCLAIEGRLRRYPLASSRRFRDLTLHVSADPVSAAPGMLLLRIEVESAPDEGDQDEALRLLSRAAADFRVEDGVALHTCLVRSLRSLAPHSVVAFCSLDTATNELTLRAASAPPELEAAAAPTLERRVDSVIAFAEADRARLLRGAARRDVSYPACPDPEDLAPYDSLAAELGAESVWSVPLAREGETLGLVVFFLRPPDAEPDAVRAEPFLRRAAAALQRNRRAQDLHSALSEKETLLREIHHRVKNNLQIIASLLNLQTDRTEDPEAIQVLAEAADRVQSMALVHTMLYGSADLTSIDAGAYLRTLALQIVRGTSAETHGVELRFRLESLQLDTDRAVPVGLIVNELVTNALKYGVGLPGSGFIEVGLARTAAGAEVSVVDSGARLPRDFRPEKVETLGMQLVLNLTRQLKGRVEFAVGEDTRFRIHFPL